MKVNSHKHENAHNFLHTCPNQAIQSAIHIYSTRATRLCNKIHGKLTIGKSNFSNIAPLLSLSPNTTPLLNWHCPSCQSLKELIQHVGGIIKILLGLPSTFRSWIPFPFHQELLSVSILPWTQNVFDLILLFAVSRLEYSSRRQCSVPKCWLQLWYMHHWVKFNACREVQLRCHRRNDVQHRVRPSPLGQQLWWQCRGSWKVISLQVHFHPSFKLQGVVMFVGLGCHRRIGFS